MAKFLSSSQSKRRKGGREERGRKVNEKEKERRKEVKRKRRIAGKNSERGHSARAEGFGR